MLWLIKVFALHWARSAPGSVTLCGQVNHLGMQSTAYTVSGKKLIP